MPVISKIDHAVLMCLLAEYQDELDEAVDAMRNSAEPLDAEGVARLAETVKLRDAMTAVRKHVGGE